MSAAVGFLGSLPMDEMPDREAVDRLLAYLPGFCASGRRFVAAPELPSAADPGAFVHAAPIYDDDVARFFLAIGAEPWMDPAYRGHQPERLVTDPELITSAPYPEVRALLNLCARGERFCEGYWLRVLEAGVVQAALRRLAVLSREADGA